MDFHRGLAGGGFIVRVFVTISDGLPGAPYCSVLLFDCLFLCADVVSAIGDRAIFEQNRCCASVILAGSGQVLGDGSATRVSRILLEYVIRPQPVS